MTNIYQRRKRKFNLLSRIRNSLLVVSISWLGAYHKDEKYHDIFRESFQYKYFLKCHAVMLGPRYNFFPGHIITSFNYRIESRTFSWALLNRFPQNLTGNNA